MNHKSIIMAGRLAALALTVVMVGAACSSTKPSSTLAITLATSTSTISGAPNAVTIDLTAKSLAFDKATISVPAGAAVTLNFSNQDSGIPHNFAAYTNSSAGTPIFVGQTVSGQATIAYKFTAPTTPGTYFFRCDIHTNMTGKLVVTP